MTKFERPGASAEPGREDEKEKAAWDKRVKKKLITGALLGASVIGGGMTMIHEASEADPHPTEKQSEKAEVKEFSAVVSEKITIPAHVQPMPTMVGRSIGVMPVEVPALYSLKISIDSHDRVVSVKKGMFDSVTVGDRVLVQESGGNITVETAE